MTDDAPETPDAPLVTRTKLPLDNGGYRFRYDVTDAGLDKIRELASNGVTDTTIGRSLGFSDRWLSEARKRDERVDDAVLAGRAMMADELTDILMTQARKGNTTAAIYLTKARLGWMEGTPPDNARANITINLPAAQSPDAYRKIVEQNTPKQLSDGNGSDTPNGVYRQ